MDEKTKADIVGMFFYYAWSVGRNHLVETKGLILGRLPAEGWYLLKIFKGNEEDSKRKTVVHISSMEKYQFFHTVEDMNTVTGPPQEEDKDG